MPVFKLDVMRTEIYVSTVEVDAESLSAAIQQTNDKFDDEGWDAVIDDDGHYAACVSAVVTRDPDKGSSPSGADRGTVMKRPANIDPLFTSIGKSIQQLEAYIVKLEGMLVERNGAIQPLDMYPPTPLYTLVTALEYGKPTFRTPELARNLLNAWLKECEEVRDRNLPRIESNRQLHATVSEYLTMIGLPTTRVQRIAKGRSLPRTETVLANWVLDVAAGHSLYFVRFTVPGHPHDHPVLCVPESWWRVIGDLEDGCSE